MSAQALELGASIFWEFNTYIKQAAEVLGLQLQVRGGSSPPHPSQKGEARCHAPECHHHLYLCASKWAMGCMVLHGAAWWLVRCLQQVCYGTLLPTFLHASHCARWCQESRVHCQTERQMARVRVNRPRRATSRA